MAWDKYRVPIATGLEGRALVVDCIALYLCFFVLVLDATGHHYLCRVWDNKYIATKAFDVIISSSCGKNLHVQQRRQRREVRGGKYYKKEHNTIRT